MSQTADIETIRQTLTADLPPLDAAGRATAWQALRMTSLAPPPARSRRRVPLRSWRTAIRIAVPAGAIAVALMIVIALGGRDGAAPVPAPLGLPTAQAAAVLKQVADHLAQGSPLTGSQARVIRQDWLQLVAGADRHGHSYRYVLPRTTEEGFDARGNAFYAEMPDGTPRFASPAAKAAYVRRFGRYVPIAPKPRIAQHYGADGSDPNFLT